MITLSALAHHLGLACDNLTPICAINTLKDAKEGELSFLDNPKYLKDLAMTKASAVLVKNDFLTSVPEGCVALVTQEPYLLLAYATKLFAPPLIETEGAEATIGEGTILAPHVFIGKNCRIGAGVTIMAGCSIGDGAVIGDGTTLYPNVTVYRDCQIGKECIIHAGAVIGSDGFGFAHTKMGEHVKIYQNGIVIIEDDVEIGANTTIDRAVFGVTRIKRGVKIDNLVQIGHNCEVGEYSIIVSQAGISGSTVLGRNVVMGGQSASAGHLKIEAFTTIAARGGVTKSLVGGKTYSGFPLMEHREWLKLQARIAKLGEV